MPVDQLPSGKARPARRDAQLVRYDEYIDQQIESTRRTVKAVDLLTAVLTIATAGLGFLLVAAIADHWLVPGGFSTAVRVLLFMALVGGIGYYSARRLWPLCVSKINPAYAAQAIERDNPSLKNSLLNLLLFRQHREEVTDAVYQTLEQQAAQRLTRVPVEGAVDRTQLLRLGYALLVVVAVAALYKILSPKDPFVTAGRVLLPWADIVPASRVSITNVEPGTVTLARGEVLEVSADVSGIGDDDPVIVRYTTADGQAVDRPSPMKPSEAGLRFTGQIPPIEESSSGGVAQNLRYRIEAGDARSRAFAVTVVAAPTITVERIDYDYPEYTGFADRSVERLGDIRAIEGTTVTIHARANQPIEEAAVDFEADGRRDLGLGVDGNRGRTSFSLALRDDRQTPKFTSYALRFTTADGRPNRDPAKFPIEVLQDFAPEVSITAPTEKIRDVRLDETLLIQFEARDPDFALSELRLHAESEGRTLVDEPAMKGPHRGRFGHRLPFTPSNYGLRVGDVVRYWATASDQRPNEASSEPQSLRIVSPDPKRPAQPPRDKHEGRDSQQNEQQDGEKQSGESGEAGGNSASQNDGENQQNGEAAADGQSSNNQQQDSSAESSEQSSSQSGESQAGEQSGENSDKSQTGYQSGEQSGESQSSGQPGEKNGDSQSDGKQSEQSGEGQQRSADSAGEGKPGSEQKGSRETGEQSDASGERNDQREGASDQKRSNQGERGAGDQAPSQESSPVSPEGDNDGDAFDRIQEFLKREGQLPKQGGQKPGSESEPTSADGQEPNEGETREDGQRESEPSGDSDAKQPGEEKQSGVEQQESNESGKQSDKSQSPQGQETSSQGESGAGDDSKQGQGQPESPPKQPEEKWQQKPSGDERSKSAGDEPPSAGRDKRESDTQGDQGGDRTGGGEEGSGQKSEREGTGSAGQNQSADEGAGESSEQGEGRDSKSAGQDAKSDERTGQTSGEEQGKGSESRETGDQPKGRNSESGQPASENGENTQDPSPGGGEQHSLQQPSKDGQSPNGAPTAGAGRTPEGTMPPVTSTGTAPDADAANLEYARQQTDLVLETLDEQLKRKKLDRKLLDELGWSEQDLRRFLERWQQLKTAAQDAGPAGDAAQRELDDALRSLGLRRSQLQTQKVSDDDLRNLRQGYRGAVPLEYQERLRAYNQGVSRARQDDE